MNLPQAPARPASLVAECPRTDSVEGIAVLLAAAAVGPSGAGRPDLLIAVALRAW